MTEPACFHDLYLDQIVTALTVDQPDYDLTWLFRTPLTDPDAIGYRQEVFRDLDQPELADLTRAFADRRLVFHARYRTRELRDDDHGIYHYYRERYFLNAVQEYCAAVLELHAGLRTHPPTSRGLARLSAYLARYTESCEFRDLFEQTQRLEGDLSAVTYAIAIRGDRLTVARYDDEPDYGQYVSSTFARFQQHTAATEPALSRDYEAYAGTGILDLVAQLHPDLFAALDGFCQQNLEYLDATVAAFDHDIAFYLTYLDFIAPLREAGLQFSYPRLSTTDKTEQALDTFDLALARTLQAPAPGGAVHGTTAHRKSIVGNDITLGGYERILVVTGPNNGGKTTLARTYGQLHYLARLGCPVPGRDTRLFVCDQIFTHFERAEDSTTLVGRLQAELNRLRDDFDAATPSSVFILNEVFTSTTAADAFYLSSQILQKVTALDALAVCVTFLDGLTTLGDSTVSMVSIVAHDDPATRTHKVIRQPADGRAYARAIAMKYGLGFEALTAQLTDHQPRETNR